MRNELRERQRHKNVKSSASAPRWSHLVMRCKFQACSDCFPDLLLVHAVAHHRSRVASTSNDLRIPIRSEIPVTPRQRNLRPHMPSHALSPQQSIITDPELLANRCLSTWRGEVD